MEIRGRDFHIFLSVQKKQKKNTFGFKDVRSAVLGISPDNSGLRNCDMLSPKNTRNLKH